MSLCRAVTALCPLSRWPPSCLVPPSGLLRGPRGWEAVGCPSSCSFAASQPASFPPHHRLPGIVGRVTRGPPLCPSPAPESGSAFRQHPRCLLCAWGWERTALLSARASGSAGQTRRPRPAPTASRRSCVLFGWGPGP